MNINTFLSVARVLPPTKSILLRGSTGIGKSFVVKTLAKEFGVEMIDVRGSTMSEGDVAGYPDLEGMKRTGVMTFCMPAWFIAACKRPVVLFLDEFNRATPQVMQSFFQIVLDRELGNDENGRPYKLHPETRVYAAINAGNEYSVQDMDPALLNRFASFEIQSSKDDWADWAKKNGVNKYIIEFISLHSEQLAVDVSKVQPGDVFPTPRSWSSFNDCLSYAKIDLNEIIGTNTHTALMNNIASSLVGQSAAAEFTKFIRDYKILLTPEDILNRFDENVERIEKCENDHLNALINKIVDHAKSNSWSTDQALNASQFGLILPDEMLVYFWNQMSKCKNIDNIQKLHKFIGEKLLQIISQSKAISK